MEYVIADVVALHQVLLEAAKVVWELYSVNIHKSITAPSLAMKIWRSKLFVPDPAISSIPSGSEVDSFIRKCYHGGILEVFAPHLKNGFSYDVNSLYPAAQDDRPNASRATRIPTSNYPRRFI